MLLKVWFASWDQPAMACGIQTPVPALSSGRVTQLVHVLVQAPYPVRDQSKEFATSTVRSTTLNKVLREGQLDQKEGVRCKKGRVSQRK